MKHAALIALPLVALLGLAVIVVARRGSDSQAQSAGPILSQPAAASTSPFAVTPTAKPSVPIAITRTPPPATSIAIPPAPAEIPREVRETRVRRWIDVRMIEFLYDILVTAEQQREIAMLLTRERETLDRLETEQTITPELLKTMKRDTQRAIASILSESQKAEIRSKVPPGGESPID